MVTFRNKNNTRRNNFRRNDRNFKSNGERPKYGSNFSNKDNFQRRVPGRNNHNASKLIEKYNEMAREALANEDRVLSENYFQHADHFTRVQNEQESIRLARVNSSTADTVNPIKTDELKKITPKPEIKKSTEKKPEEKKSVAS